MNLANLKGDLRNGNLEREGAAACDHFPSPDVAVFGDEAKYLSSKLFENGSLRKTNILHFYLCLLTKIALCTASTDLCNFKANSQRRFRNFGCI